MQSSRDAGRYASSREPVNGRTKLALGLTVAGLLVLLAVIGGSAEHGPGSAQLRREPASIVLSVLITLAVMAGAASLALLIWGLVTRHRRSLDGSAPRRHSPILVAGAMLAILACLAALLALAARRRHDRQLGGLGAGPVSHAHSGVAALPFNTAASAATSGVVIAIIAVLVLLRVVPSMGWGRALRRLRPFHALGQAAMQDDRAEALVSLRRDIAALGLADTGVEPDPRRAVIACYLKMLEAASRNGPRRQTTETPTEYLRRMLAWTGAGAVPATALTGLFERARYSERPVDESMRSEAITALAALRDDLLTGAVA